MPAIPTKRPKASAVKQSSIKDTNAFLQALPEKPKEDLSLREAVEQMRESVRGALAKGYSYQELAAMLTEKGIKISAFTLKNYVPSGRRRSTKEQPAPTPAKRGRKPKAESALFSPPEPETASSEGVTNYGTVATAFPDDEAAQVETKSPRGRGRSTTAAKSKPENEATVKQPATRRRRSSMMQDGSTTAARGRKKAGT